MSTKNSKRTLTRYVYILDVTLPFWDLRRWSLLLCGDRLVKIGVAKDASARAKAVDASHEATVRLSDRYYCNNATRHESHLHRTFKGKQFVMVGMDGGTEVFRLSAKEIRHARRYLERISNRRTVWHRITWTAAFTAACVALFIIYQFLQ